MKIDVKIDPAAGPIAVELTFGFACVGSYQATIYDTSNQNGNTFINGTSTDNVPDVFTPPHPPSELVGRTLLIDAALVPPSPPDMVSITAQVLQGGAPLPDAALTAKAAVGPGQKATPMLFIRFK